MSANEPIRKRVRVRCSVAHAFATFTDRIDLWWPSSHRILAVSSLRMEARAGGRFYERTAAGEEARLGEVVHWEPPSRVVYTWYPGAIELPTRVEVRFTADGDFTIVDVVHAEGDSRLGDQWTSRAQRFERAWQQVLPAFEGFVGSEH